ncbi:MAG: hypothetical protein Harvfovirus14_2 [Harvfovirus sp.]|uniref:Uncharacterized protein n=1 Tax=Harvfovirus sp. TaxID=2487768 RepID=A0A3G5A482_9VIRU|nr:MAG: hypothetical protein Harvfovirus14_2 [Harvfovirus sp.]
MQNIDGKEITKIIEFTHVDREDIVLKKNYDSIVDMSEELFACFSKAGAGWPRREITKNYTLSFLRYACKDLGLNFGYVKKDKSETINGKKYKRPHCFYSITTG